MEKEEKNVLQDDDDIRCLRRKKRKRKTNAYKHNNNVENINDAKRVAEATIDLTKGGEQTDAKTTTNLNKDIQNSVAQNKKKKSR